MNAHVTDRDQVTRPTLAQLLQLTWPVIISRSAQVVVGFTDAAMCARLGEEALAATTAGATNSFNVFVFFIGMSFIVASYTSQLAGKRDYEGARRYGYYGLLIAALAGLAGVVSLPFIDGALAHLDYAPAVRTLMGDYLRVRLLSCGFAVGLEALGSYYGGLGNTRLPMAAQILDMLLNVVLCWVLIYGHLGAPALGVVGSALASTLATGIAFAFLLACFLLGVAQEGDPHARTVLHRSEFLRMLRFAVPTGMNWFIEFAAFSFFINVVVAGMGTTAVAALMAVSQLTSVSYMPAFAVASSGAIFIGRAIGARRPDDVPRTVGLALLAATSWQGLSALACILFPDFLMRAFLQDPDQQQGLLTIGVRFLMLSAAWQLFDAASMVFAESLRAAGDTAFTFWTRAVIAWAIFAPGAWVCARVLHTSEVVTVAWLVVYLGLLALVLLLRFRSGRWRTLQLTVSAPA
jgi:MATE family multidrug resistance protein